MERIIKIVITNTTDTEKEVSNLDFKITSSNDGVDTKTEMLEALGVLQMAILKTYEVNKSESD